MEHSSSWSKPDDTTSLLCRKLVDWSVLVDGMTIPEKFHKEFTGANGELALHRGSKHIIDLLIEGKAYDAFLMNIDRKGVKGDTLQIRYDSNHQLKEKFSEKFQVSRLFLTSARELLRGNNKRVFAKVPREIAEYIEFHSTGTPYRYNVRLVSANNILSKKEQHVLANIDEQLLERMINNSNDSEFLNWVTTFKGLAGVKERKGIVKERKYQRSVITTLKEHYQGTCQICGWSALDEWGVDVSEVHHIDPFITSFDNRPSNLIVVCPTHHTLLHSLKAQLDLVESSFKCSNGKSLNIVLDDHLVRGNSGSRNKLN